MLLNRKHMKKFICSTVLAFLVITNYAQVDRSKAPEAGPAPKITLGKYESFTLKNGLKVIVVENHKLPKVSYSLVVDADPTLEGNKAGYVSMFGEMLGRGTKTRTKIQIDEEADLIGATLNPNAGGIYAGCLKKYNEKLLELMSDIILNPSFPQEEFDKVVKRTRDGLETVKTDVGAIAANLTATTVYGKNHPYGDVETDSTVSNITLQDLKDYYAKNFMPNVSYIAIVGDITKAEAQPLMEKYFGGWVKGTPAKVKLTNPTPPANPEIIMNDRAGSKQTTLRFVYPVQNTVGGEDYLKVRLLNTILGGGATGRLFMTLREKHGYTYGAYSSISADENVGQFTASADVRTEVTDSAIYQFISEFNKISTGGVTVPELQSAKNELTGSFAIGLEDPQTVARFAINIDMYKLPKDYYENYLTNLNAVTIEDVNAAAVKYVLPFNYHIIVVGDRAAIEKKILKYDTDKKITFLDPFGYPAPELKAVPEGVTAQTVMDNYIAAVGGKDAISKIKDATATGKVSAMFGQMEYKQINKYPNKQYISFTIPSMGSQEIIFNGTAGKSAGLGGDYAYDEKMVKDANADAMFAYELDLTTAGMQATLLGIDLVEGKDAYKIEFIYPSGKKSYSWYSTKNNLKIRTLTIEETNGEQSEQIFVYSDYKDAGGVLYPYYVKTPNGDLVIEKIDVNTNVSDDAFKIK